MRHFVKQYNGQLGRLCTLTHFHTSEPQKHVVQKPKFLKILIHIWRNSQTNSFTQVQKNLAKILINSMAVQKWKKWVKAILQLTPFIPQDSIWSKVKLIWFLVLQNTIRRRFEVINLHGFLDIPLTKCSPMQISQLSNYMQKHPIEL